MQQVGLIKVDVFYKYVIKQKVAKTEILKHLLLIQRYHRVLQIQQLTARKHVYISR